MKKTKIVNLTPHSINLVTEGGTLTIPPSGTVARVSSVQQVVREIEVDGVKIPVVETQFGQVEGLPEPQEGVLFVVSSLVAQAVTREDVVSPNTAPTPLGAVRDDDGRITGIKSLQSFNNNNDNLRGVLIHALETIRWFNHLPSSLIWETIRELEEALS